MKASDVTVCNVIAVKPEATAQGVGVGLGGETERHGLTGELAIVIRGFRP